MVNLEIITNKENPDKDKSIAVREYLKENYLKMEEEGLPIDLDGRINPEFFKDIYSRQVLEDDRRLVEELLKKEYEGYGDLSLAEIKKIKAKQLGEQFECLATAIFQKFFSNRFYILRSSEYDDQINNVDNILIDKESGNIICAFDEVGEIKLKDKRFEDKKEQVLNINLEKEGARLKYGVIFGPQTKTFTPSRVNHIPIFYLALSPFMVQEGIKNFKEDKDNEYDQNLYKYFRDSLSAQITELKLRLLHPELLQKIDNFEQTIVPDFSPPNIKNKR